MIRFPRLLLLAALLAFPCAALAAEPPAAPPLGSPDYLPSPDHPVGWRGDGTGRFPAATPPLTWSRRVNGITSEIKCQAAKPAAEPGKDAARLEYFAVKDWLYAGPFNAEDPVRDIDKDLLAGETTVTPDANAPAGDSVWKPLHIAMDNQMHPGCNEGGSFLSVDFTYLFGLGAGKDDKTAKADLISKAAYAHTYIYAPRAAHVRLEIPFAGAAARAWLNGNALPDLKQHPGPADVALVQGWNRLLIKVTAKDVKQHLSWLCRAYLLPTTPISYSTTNIAWMTKLPGFCVSQPIIVGDRIFLGSGISDLVCLSKTDGRILWLKSNTYCDILTDDEKKAVPDYESKFAPQQKKLDALNTQVVSAINAAITPQGLSSDQAALLDKLILEKRDTEWALAKAFQAVDKKNFAIYGQQSSATPCSDGRAVYWVCNEGSTTFTACDLDGKRLWAYHAALGNTEHGNNSSPILCEGKLIYAANTTRLALDAKTGAVAWQAKFSPSTNANSPQIIRIGDVPVVVHPSFLCRVSDGSEICKFAISPWGDHTPLVEDGILYSPSNQSGWKGPYMTQKFLAIKLPDRIAPGVKPTTLWESSSEEITLSPQRDDNYMVASPLYTSGLVYSLGMDGWFCATDPAAKKNIYKLFLEGHNRYNRGLFGYCASLTLAGSKIFITDDVGFTHIIQPGPTFTDGGRNILENLNLTGQVMCWGGNPGKQEEFYTAPWFEGKSLYLRGTDYLYCIREPAK